jgi:hypothetical protein
MDNHSACHTLRYIPIPCLFLSLDTVDCVVVLLSESVEKHDRNVAVFMKVLDKPIKYVQPPIEDFYKTITNSGMSHSVAYDLISIYSKSGAELSTPQVSILIHSCVFK